MNSRPIGMFDSGVGGLTVLKEVIKQCPNEKIIYLGDTKRFPYGSKPEETIIDLTKKGIDFLISKNVKAVVIACGTATSQALEEVQKCYDIPIIGIINAAVRYIKNKEYKDIGVIATTGTIRSKGWQNKINEIIPNAVVSYKACPLLAPMAEEGWTNNEIARLTIKEYLKDLKNIECLILGCTHYPLFKEFIREELGNDKEIINTGEMVSIELAQILKNKNMQNEELGDKDYEIYLTEMETNFIKVANKLLKNDNLIEKIKKIEI